MAVERIDMLPLLGRCDLTFEGQDRASIQHWQGIPLDRLDRRETAVEASNRGSICPTGARFV
jgi:hypothetical protein